MRPLIRLSNKYEALQLRLFGTSFIAVTRRRDVLLLETIGRKSGKRRRTPVTFLRDEDGNIVIGGGAGGMTKVDWVANLRQMDDAVVRVRRRVLRVVVEELKGAERDAAHARALARFPEISDYERVSNRTVPYFRLSER